MALNAKPLTFWVSRTSVIKPEKANSSLEERPHAKSLTENEGYESMVETYQKFC